MPQDIHKILLIEDDPSNVRTYELMLKIMGLQFEVARDGQMAESCFDPCAHRIVLVDINLPDISGYEVLEKLRQRVEDGPEVYFIAQTARVTTGEQQRCMENGFDDYISKPVRLDDFKAMMAKYTDKFPQDAFANS